MTFDKDGYIDWILISTTDDKYFENAVIEVTAAVLLQTMYKKKKNSIEKQIIIELL